MSDEMTDKLHEMNEMPGEMVDVKKILSKNEVEKIKLVIVKNNNTVDWWSLIVRDISRKNRQP